MNSCPQSVFLCFRVRLLFQFLGYVLRATDSWSLKSEVNIGRCEPESAWHILDAALESHLAGGATSFTLREAKKKIETEVESMLHVTI